MHSEIERIIKKCLLISIYFALIKIYSKFDAINYILSRFKHLNKLTLIMFVFFKIMLIVERISNLFEF